MPTRAKWYVAAVIAAGGVAFCASLAGWRQPASAIAVVAYLLLGAGLSAVKLRLPGMTGTYSLNYLVLLYGLLHFDLSVTMLAAAIAALAQSYLNAASRPTPVQVAFNVANLSLSLEACQLTLAWTSRSALALYMPAQVALIAALYFVVNTGLVSGVLSLLQGRRLADVTEEWYVWSLPYYLVGTTLVGCLPGARDDWSGAAWLVLIPLLYLVHFFIGLSRQEKVADGAPKDDARLSVGARAFFFLVLAAGAAVLVWALSHGTSDRPVRFAAYAILAAVASTWKVRLPHMVGTISVSFVVLLVAIQELAWAEIAIMAVVVILVQVYWKAARAVSPLQLAFNISTQAISTILAGWICRVWLGAALADAPVASMVVAAAVLYLSSSVLVAGALCAVQGRPLSEIWRNTYFWVLPYYLVGSAAATVMVRAELAAGWMASAAVLPLMALVYISYRAHVTRSAEPATA